jgi:colicin import membrane protein
VAEAGLYLPKSDPASQWISVIASILMHGVLLAVLVYGVSWQSRAPEAVSAELVQSLPPLPVETQTATPPKPAPQPPAEPKPQNKPEPKPEPKPDIAIKKPEPKKLEKKPEPPKPEPTPTPKPKQEPKPKDAKPTPAEDPLKRLLDQESKRLDQAKVKNQLDQEAKRAAQAREEAGRKTSTQAATTALGNAREDWANRIRGKVRGNISLPPAISGFPKAEFELELLPDGSIAREPRLTKSSGIPALDEAIKRAILKSDPLPLPAKAEVFERSLKLVFDPLRD